MADPTVEAAAIILTTDAERARSAHRNGIYFANFLSNVLRNNEEVCFQAEIAWQQIAPDDPFLHKMRALPAVEIGGAYYSLVEAMNKNTEKHARTDLTYYGKRKPIEGDLWDGIELRLGGVRLTPLTRETGAQRLWIPSGNPVDQTKLDYMVSLTNSILTGNDIAPYQAPVES